MLWFPHCPVCLPVCLHTHPDHEARPQASGERAGVGLHTDDSDLRLPVWPTFEQLHGAQLERDAVRLGENVDGTTGLGQQVQVELQAHGDGGRQTQWTHPRGRTGSQAAGRNRRVTELTECAQPTAGAWPRPPRPLDGS